MTMHSGKCYCGNIEYQFRGEPVNAAFCYCHTCQVQTNSDKWFGLWVPEDAFAFTKGDPSSFTRPGDSGMKMEHKFCSNCGTSLAIFVEAGRFYSVAAATVSDHTDFQPDILIYTSHAPDWTVFPEGVPRFDLLPPELTGGE